MSEPYTPAYFRTLADDYIRRADDAARFELPNIIVQQLRMAGIQFRYAADAIEIARKPLVRKR